MQHGSSHAEHPVWKQDCGARAGRRIGQTKDRRSPSHRTTIDGATRSWSACEDPQRRTRPLPGWAVRRFVVAGLGPFLHERQEVALAIASPLLGDGDRRHAGLAGKRCSRLASQQQRQDVAFEPLRPTSSGSLEARLNQESATCLYGRFGIDGLRTHTHSRVAGVVHEPTVGVVPAAGQQRAIPSWPRPMTTVSLSGRLTEDLLRRLGMVLSCSAVLAGWQCRQGVELGLVQGDVGRGGVGGDLLCSFGADDRRGDRRAG